LIVEIDASALWPVFPAVILSVLLGRMVERRAHFIWPIDAYSLAIYGACLALGAAGLVLPQVPSLLVLVSALSYLVGFVAAGRRRHVNVVRLNAASRIIEAPFVVPYRKGNDWYLRYQSPREHLKNILWPETEARLETNWDMEKQWAIRMKDPFFPVPEMTGILASRMDLERHDFLRPGKRVKIKRYLPLIEVAPGDMDTPLETMFRIEGLEGAIAHSVRMGGELMRAKHVAEQRSVFTIARMLNENLWGASPIEQLRRVSEEERAGQARAPEKPRAKLFGRRRRGGDGGEG
jgi:hypothetical protein